jgi:hypothetical protein
MLNRHQGSAFRGLVRRISDTDEAKGVVVDSALMTVIKNSLNSPLGALSPYKGGGGALVFWQAVKDAFPDAWGPPRRAVDSCTRQAFRPWVISWNA